MAISFKYCVILDVSSSNNDILLSMWLWGWKQGRKEGILIHAVAGGQNRLKILNSREDFQVKEMWSSIYTDLGIFL